jgi:cell division GTPase FtsZ
LEILKNGKWIPIDNFRTVLNFIIHAEEVITKRHKKYIEMITKCPLSGNNFSILRTIESVGEPLIILGKLHQSDKLESPMAINIGSFCDMVFRIVEERRLDCVSGNS